MEYRGVKIELSEAKSFTLKDGWVFGQPDGLVFRAVSKYGEAYALTGESCLRLAKDLIDKKLSKEPKEG